MERTLPVPSGGRAVPGDAPADPVTHAADPSERLAWLMAKAPDWDLVRIQMNYLETVADPEERKKMRYAAGLSNRFWPAATIAGMAREPEYAPVLADLFNDRDFRVYAIKVLGPNLPRLVGEIAAGRRVSADDVPSLVPETPEELVARYTSEIRPRLPAELADRNEAANPNRCVFDILRWREHRERGVRVPEPGYRLFWAPFGKSAQSRIASNPKQKNNAKQ